MDDARRLILFDGPFSDNRLAGPIEMRLPAGVHAYWHPAVAQTMIGRLTTLELDGVRHVVRVDKAERDLTDPQFLLITLVAVD